MQSGITVGNTGIVKVEVHRYCSDGNHINPQEILLMHSKRDFQGLITAVEMPQTSFLNTTTGFT